MIFTALMKPTVIHIIVINMLYQVTTQSLDTALMVSLKDRVLQYITETTLSLLKIIA